MNDWTAMGLGVVLVTIISLALYTCVLVPKRKLLTKYLTDEEANYREYVRVNHDTGKLEHVIEWGKDDTWKTVSGDEK